MSKIKSPKSKPRDCSVVSESGEVCWKVIMRKFSESHRQTCREDHVAMPKEVRSMKEFPTGSKYDGSWNLLGISGRGTYRFPHGVTYEGEFEDGEFHGEGVLRYENGIMLRGKFDRGVMTERSLVFEDGLEYSETGWKYCELPDRRFTVEYDVGLGAAGESFMTAVQPTIEVPLGYYDTGDGFFEPKSNAIYKYDNLADIIRSPLQREREWIMKNCRRGMDSSLGPHHELYEEWQEPQLELNEPPPPAAFSGSLYKFEGDSEHSSFDFEECEEPSFRLSHRRSTISKGRPRLFYKSQEKPNAVVFGNT